MAETVGRVDFIVNLDGRGLPAQARRLASDIAAQGTIGGREFGENFDSALDRSLSQVGRRSAGRLESQGRLLGRTFGEGIDSEVTERVQRTAAEVERALASDVGFDAFRRNFSSVGEAVDELRARIDFLRTQTLRRFTADGQAVDIPYFGRHGSWIDAVASLNSLAERFGELEQAETSQRERSEELEVAWSRLSRVVGDTDAFRKAARELGSTGAAFDTLNRNIHELGDGLGKSRIEIEDLADRLDRTRLSAGNLKRELTGFERAVVGLGSALSKPFGALDNDMQLVLGIIASAADQIAVLGSAAGAGLVGIGAAASEAVIGLGGVVAVLKVFSSDIQDLPADLRPAAQELTTLKNSFIGLADSIAQGASQTLDGAFGDLAGSVQALSPEFERLGKVVGSTFRGFADAIAPGTDAFGEITTLIENATDDFPKLASVAGTFGGALVRAFNRAQPLVQDLLGWLQDIGDEFDAFTRSRAFDDWVANAQRVFGSLGGLIDSTARTLNNLATPEAVGRTTDLLDNLSDFIPVLGEILDVIGRLDPIGLFVEALNDAGQVIEPLLPALGTLADVLNNVAQVILSPGLIAGIASLAGAFALARGADGLGDLAAKLEGTSGALSGLATPALKAGTALEAIGRVGKRIGVVVAAVSLLDSVVHSTLLPSMDETAQKFRDAGDATEAWDAILRSNTLGVFVDLAGGAEESLKGFGTMLDNWAKSAGSALPYANGFTANVKTLGETLGTVAGNDFPAAIEEFQSLASAASLTDEQQATLLSHLGPFREALARAAGGAELATDSATLLGIAQGKISTTTEDNTDRLKDLATQTDLTKDEVDDLADAIRGFGSEQLNTRDASRQYESALDDLRDSLEENGNEFRDTEAAGRANNEAVDSLISGTTEYAAAILEQTGNQDQANAALAAGKQALLDMLNQFDPAGVAAGNYNDILNLIPTDITTVATADTEDAQTKVTTYNGLVSQIPLILPTTMQTPGIDVAQQAVDNYTAALSGVKPFYATTFNLPTVDKSTKAVDNLNQLFGKTPLSTTTETKLPTIDTAAQKVENLNELFGKTPTETSTDTKLPTIGTATDKVTTLNTKLDKLDGRTVSSYVNVYTTNHGAPIPQGASGMLLTGPRVILAGEAGAEAIVPLERPLAQVDPSVRALSAFAQGYPTTAMANGGVVGGRSVIIQEGAIQINAPDPWRAATETVNRITERVVA